MDNLEAAVQMFLALLWETPNFVVNFRIASYTDKRVRSFVNMDSMDLTVVMMSVSYLLESLVAAVLMLPENLKYAVVMAAVVSMIWDSVSVVKSNRSVAVVLLPSSVVSKNAFDLCHPLASIYHHHLTLELDLTTVNNPINNK